MLRNLHIRNLALIREVDVDFKEGLNILTGETGSGKSILIDSIGLALGGRIQRDLTGREGDSLVELVFEVTDETVLRALREMGIEPEDGCILISRRIHDGRSVIRVNGETRTAAEVRECARLLLDIHGQSEHQKLLRSDRQLALIDEYGGEKTERAREKTAAAFREWSALKKELEKDEMSGEERARRLSFLEYEIRDIEDAALYEGEDEELERTYRKLSNARKIAEAVETVHAATGYESSESAGNEIGRALKKLEGVSDYDGRLEELAGQLSGIEDLLNDFNRELASYAEDLSFEEASFEETEERLNLINKMKARYGRTIPDILSSLADKKADLAALENYEERRKELKKNFEKAEAALENASAALTAVRKETADRFAGEAVREFQGLNFARADFSAVISETDGFTSNGKDHIEFMIATNPGEKPRPLRQVVSGGELSRLMLGIRTMFAGADATETVIFDEVDTGISGRTAQKAAEKLADLAGTHQVLCISHLPQIAAMADTHYGITKELGDDEAITRIEALSDEASVGELARLIGGAEITVNTLESAREMKDMCRQYKQNKL